MPAASPRDARPTAIVADALPLVRAGMVQALESCDCEVVSETADVLELVDLARRHCPHLVVLGALGPPALPEVAAALRPLVTALVALVPPGDARAVAELLNAEVDVIVTRTAQVATLTDAARRALNGGRWLDPAVMDTRIDLTADTGVPALTTREREVLALLREGRTNRDIARHLFVSVPTVKTHLAHIYAKLGATNRNEALGRAVALGLLP